MKLYLDDVRDRPDASWTLARTIPEAIQILSDARAFEEPWEVVSLDYDLGMTCTEPHSGWQPFGCSHTDGMQLLAWFAMEDCWPGEIRIHSANPGGRELMEAFLRTQGFGA